MSYLSDRDLRKVLKAKSLTITPSPEDEQFSPCSIDLRLGEWYTPLPEPPTGYGTTAMSVRAWPQDVFDKKKIVGALELKEGEFLLAWTHEKVAIAPTAPLIGFIEGKSSTARHGVSVHCTAPTVHPGWDGELTLELKNHGRYPVMLKPGELIGQLLLARLSSRVQRPYGAHSPAPLPGYRGEGRRRSRSVR